MTRDEQNRRTANTTSTPEARRALADAEANRAARMNTRAQALTGRWAQITAQQIEAEAIREMARAQIARMTAEKE